MGHEFRKFGTVKVYLYSFKNESLPFLRKNKDILLSWICVVKGIEKVPGEFRMEDVFLNGIIFLSLWMLSNPFLCEVSGVLLFSLTPLNNSQYLILSIYIFADKAGF
jgi:hypothetical protein